MPCLLLDLLQVFINLLKKYKYFAIIQKIMGEEGFFVEPYK